MIAEEIECDTYFAKSYCSQYRSWAERERFVVAIFSEKYGVLLDITAQQVVSVSAVDKLNSRRKKCLNFQTLYKLFEKLPEIDTRKIMDYALIT